MPEAKPTKVNKKEFEVEVEGKKLKLVVKRPDQKQQAQGQLVYNRAFREAVKPDDGGKGAIVRGALEGVLREQKLWDDSKQAEYDRLTKSLRDGERALVKGGVKLSEGRETAIQMRRDRQNLEALLSERNSLDGITAEAQAENARFNHWVATCTLDAAKGTPYFKSNADYESRADDPVAEKAAQALANLVYSLDEGWRKKLPEEQWLRAYDFSREEDGHLIDRQGGWLCRADGRRVNEEGQLVNEDGHAVDEDGNLVASDGSPLGEAAPFIDDLTEEPVPIPPSLSLAKSPAEVSEKLTEKSAENKGEQEAPAKEESAKEPALASV